jgi:hypothetical protein
MPFPGTENYATAKFLIGGNRPTLVLREEPTNGRFILLIGHSGTACDLYPTEGFSHFVTSMTAPIASGRSENCRVRFAPTEKRRLNTAHAITGHSWEISEQ